MESKISEKVAVLIEIFSTSNRYPFPLDDCRKILRKDNHIENFVPDLDLFFIDIAGYCSNAKKLSSFSYLETTSAAHRISQSFFEKYPKYEPLESSITSQNTPDLKRIFDIYELLRTKLVEIFALRRC